jgi:NAD(P)-dependent dehydrogenase (short-subunit alcohol dehydrogenase family)
VTQRTASKVEPDIASGQFMDQISDLNRVKVRRFGEPTDFGGIAVYLMSKASSYHTADCFIIDGGYTAF